MRAELLSALELRRHAPPDYWELLERCDGYRTDEVEVLGLLGAEVVRLPWGTLVAIARPPEGGWFLGIAVEPPRPGVLLVTPDQDEPAIVGDTLSKALATMRAGELG